MIEINLNDTVYVQLTDEGRKELKRQHEELRKLYPNLRADCLPKEDPEGWSRWQLWILIRDLGQNISMGGSDLPFSTGIRLEEKHD